MPTEADQTKNIVEAYKRAGAEVSAALTAAGCDSPDIFSDVMKRLNLRHIEDDEGRFSVIVVDDKGNPRTQENHMPVSVKQAARELIAGKQTLKRAIFDKLPAAVKDSYIRGGGRCFD